MERPREVRDRVRAAVDRGIEFLLARQGSDGLWRDFHTPAGEASTWTSGYVGHALAVAGADRGPLRHAADALARCQHVDGGWGYHEDTPSDADSTSWTALFLTRLGVHDGACRAAERSLIRQQRRGGGVATYARAAPIRRYTGMPRWLPFRGWCHPQVEVSAVAGQALAALSSTDAKGAVAAWRYVRSEQYDDGSWPSYWWTTDHVATQQAVTLAVRMGDPEPLLKAAAWILRGQRADGGWTAPGSGTSPFATALALSSLTACGHDHSRDQSRPVARGLDALLTRQQADGGWPTHPILRIPLPPDRRRASDDRRRLIEFDPGIVVEDQHRTFTTATCVAALAGVTRATG